MTYRLSKGLIQVYTGEGKGKTTASLGLALRAVGQGLHVYILQLLKPQRLSSGEMKILKNLSETITIERLKVPWWSLQSFKRPKDIERLKKVLNKKLEELYSLIELKQYDMIILDEINNCLHYNIIDCSEMIAFIKKKPENTELVLTGRNAPAEIIALADLVTEMQPVKHPFSRSIKARKGIEY